MAIWTFQNSNYCSVHWTHTQFCLCIKYQTFLHSLIWNKLYPCSTASPVVVSHRWSKANWPWLVFTHCEPITWQGNPPALPKQMISCAAGITLAWRFDQIWLPCKHTLERRSACCTLRQTTRPDLLNGNVAGPGRARRSHKSKLCCRHLQTFTRLEPFYHTRARECVTAHQQKMLAWQSDPGRQQTNALLMMYLDTGECGTTSFEVKAVFNAVMWGFWCRVSCCAWDGHNKTNKQTKKDRSQYFVLAEVNDTPSDPHPRVIHNDR